MRRRGLPQAFGASRVFVTTSGRNFDYCRKLGADELIDYTKDNWCIANNSFILRANHRLEYMLMRTRVGDETMDRRWDVVANSTLDVVYDTVGQDDTGARAVSKLRGGGFYVTITGALAPSTPAGVGQAMFINSDTNLGSADMLDAIGRMVDDGKVLERRKHSRRTAASTDLREHYGILFLFTRCFIVRRRCTLRTSTARTRSRASPTRSRARGRGTSSAS